MKSTACRVFIIYWWAFAALTFLPAPISWAFVAERVSVSSAGDEGNSGGYNPSISSDGRFVAFTSYASNLVPGDNNGRGDVFIHDRTTRQTTRVSVSSAGVQGNGHSYNHSISADGRFVAFSSDAYNLVPGDNNGWNDVFVHDRTTHQITRVSVSSAGAEANGGSFLASISADGGHVTFNSYAGNLVSGLSPYAGVFVHDRTTHETDLLSVSSTGSAADGPSYYPSISAYGRYIMFHSGASNLVTDDGNDAFDIFSVHNFSHRYVQPEGSDTANDCSDPQNACKTIRHALSRSSSQADVIRVAKGNYKEPLYVNKATEIQGGWNSGFTSRSQDAGATVINASYNTPVLQCEAKDLGVELKLSNLTLARGGDSLYSGDYGGGISASNLGVYLNIILENVQIIESEMQGGAGIWVDTGGAGAKTLLKIMRSHIRDNRAMLLGGGGIYIRTNENSSAKLILENSILSDNYGMMSGGALLIRGDGLNEVEILNSTITRNIGNQSGGGVMFIGNTRASITNSIIWNNTQINTWPGDDIYLAKDAYVYASYSDIGKVDKYPPSTYVDGGNNFNEDPKFVNAAGGDFHLRSESPAKDRALCAYTIFYIGGSSAYIRVAPLVDFDNQRRPLPNNPGSLVYLGCDCGADELVASLSHLYLLLLD